MTRSRSPGEASRSPIEQGASTIVGLDLEPLRRATPVVPETHIALFLCLLNCNARAKGAHTAFLLKNSNGAGYNLDHTVDVLIDLGASVVWCLSPAEIRIHGFRLAQVQVPQLIRHAAATWPNALNQPQSESWPR